MITDSKFVKGVKSNSPKKGWKITWHDDKYDNFFDESWLGILERAQQENRMITTTKEKNDAGYWNIKTLALAEIDIPEQKPPTDTSPREDETPRKSSPETGMWWKELGDMLRSGDIDKSTKQGKLLRLAYYTEMFHVLGLKFEKPDEQS